MSTNTGYNPCIFQGKPFYLTLAAKDANDAPMNLSGYYVAGSIKRKFSDDNALINFNTGIISLVSGMVSVGISATGTASLPVTRLVYDVEAYNPDTEDVIELLRGAAYVYPEVTT